MRLPAWIKPLSILALLTLSTTSGHAATCVSKPVMLVVPYPSGGLSDVIARHLNTALSRQLGQPVIVENLAGASGSIAAQKVLSAPADGHTMFLGSPNEVILARLASASIKLRHDQFRLLGQVTVNPLVLLGRRDLPAQNVDELITLARASGAKPLTYASVGYGSLYHFAGEDLAEQTGAKLLHVPYKGGAPLLQDLGGGVVDFVFLPWATMFRGMADQGRFKIMGWAAPKRDSLAADIPAFGEGNLLNGFEYSTWSGLMVRKDTPAATVTCLHQALAATLGQPEFQQHILATGSRPASAQSLDEAARQFDAEAQRFQALAKRVNLQPQ